MKGIRICAECANYSTKKHRCTLGASKEDDPRNPFYDDCPLPEVAPVKPGRWEPVGKLSIGLLTEPMQFYKCSACGSGEFSQTNFCPNCGAKMDGGNGHD